MMGTDHETLNKPADVEKNDDFQVTTQQTAQASNAANDVDGDEALKACGLGIEVSDADNKRLLRKIDWNVQPLLMIIYGLQYLDKTTLSYASIMGLRTDNHVTSGEYSTLASLFYVGYLVWEFPTNRLLQRLPLAKYSAFNIVTWGAILCCMAACTNFSGLAAVRFFLGMFEASVTPGFTLFTSQWYRKSEQGTRTGVWFAWNGVAQILGGVLAYGIARADAAGNLAIAGWKLVFVLTGLVTVAFGVLLFFFMPDSPLKARWLSPEDRVLAVERLRGNQQGIGNKQYKPSQAKEAFTDPLTWLFVLYSLLSDIPNGGLTNYFSVLIRSFGYTTEQALLYGAPGGAIEIVTIILFLWLGDKYRMRLLFGACSQAIALLGIVMVYALPERLKVGRLIGYYLCQASATGFVVLLSLISSNVAGYTKKTTVQAMFLVAYCVGNLIGPQVFRGKDAPRYTPALITIVICWSLCIVVLFLIWAYNVKENRRKDAIVNAPGYKKMVNQEFMDLTDRENPEFRYES